MSVEFTSPESGVYVHEMTDKIEIKIIGSADSPYMLKLFEEKDEHGNPWLQVDLVYDDGVSMRMESIALEKTDRELEEAS